MRQGKVFFAALLALALVAAAQAAESSLHALFACQEISADAARLACLDREVAALRGERKPSASVAADRQKAAEESYGRERPSAPLATSVRDKDGRVEGLENLAVARVSKTPLGKLVVKLQNGQIWTQTDSIEIFLPRDTSQEELTASIRDAALGSYKMQLNGAGPWFRVSREE